MASRNLLGKRLVCHLEKKRKKKKRKKTFHLFVFLLQVYIGGHVMPDNIDATIVVPLAKPGEVVQVAVDCKVPGRLGRAFGNFRLSTAAGVRFGSQIWADVTVVAAKPSPAQPVQ